MAGSPPATDENEIPLVIPGADVSFRAKRGICYCVVFAVRRTAYAKHSGIPRCSAPGNDIFKQKEEGRERNPRDKPFFVLDGPSSFEPHLFIKNAAGE